MRRYVFSIIYDYAKGGVVMYMYTKVTSLTEVKEIMKERGIKKYNLAFHGNSKVTVNWNVKGQKYSENYILYN